MKTESKIYVAGHTGLVGSAIIRLLKIKKYENIIKRNSKELDLTSQQAVNNFFEKEKPAFVFLAAGKVGGIQANIDYPADFIHVNLQIETNIIHSAWKNGVKKLLFIGCACMYPKVCPQPMDEPYLLSGKVEPTNESYSIAKIAGMMMCQSYYKQYGAKFINCIATNIYGPDDNMNVDSSHFLPAIIQKIHSAKINRQKEVILWGTGKPRRELLHVDDLAEALLFLMQNYDKPETINIGTGKDFSIKEIANIVKKIVGYQGDIVFDPSKPDGMLRKLLNSDRIYALGWRPKISLIEGITQFYRLLIEKSS